MAFIKSNFLDFLGLFTQPQDLHSPVDTFQGPQTSPGRMRLLPSRFRVGRASLGATDKELPGCAGGKSACCELGTKREAVRYLAV